MNAVRQIGKHSNPSGISMKPLGVFIVTPPRFHSNPSAAVAKPASRRSKTRQSADRNPPVDGSIPASRPRRRQAGIRAASGGFHLPSRRVLGCPGLKLQTVWRFSGSVPEFSVRNRLYLHFNRKSQRGYVLKYAPNFYQELQAMGLHRLQWRRK